MSFNYSGDPGASSLDAVRFLIRDTDDGNPLLADEEIAYWSGRCDPVFGDDLMTAAFCAENIAARYASEVSISADGESIAAEQLQTKYTTLAAALRAQYKTLNGVGGLPLVGGVDWWVMPELGVRPTSFGRGKDDNTRAGRSEYGYREAGWGSEDDHDGGNYQGVG